MIPNVVAVKINKSLDLACKVSLGKKKNVKETLVRKSVKDMTIKYWSYRNLKNCVDNCNIVIGVVNGVIYSAFKVEDYRICERLGTNNTYRERVEFICQDSVDELIGIDLGSNAIGGWVVKTYNLDDLNTLKVDQGKKVQERRKEIFNLYQSMKIEYNLKESYQYDNHYYGDDRDSYIRTEKVKRETHLRSNYICEWCNKKSQKLECHHIELLARGGADCLSNTVSVCNSCHKSFHKNKYYDRDVKPKLMLLRKV